MEEKKPLTPQERNKLIGDRVITTLVVGTMMLLTYFVLSIKATYFS